MLTTSQYVRIDYKGLSEYCFVMDELKWLGKLSPSFLLIVPNLENLTETNKGTNGTIIYPKPAQTTLNYHTLIKGKANLYSYFFGREKPGRTFDLIFRLFEEGFSLDNFKGFEANSPLILTKDSEISISTKGYKHPSIITGKVKDTETIPARILRVK